MSKPLSELGQKVGTPVRVFIVVGGGVIMSSRIAVVFPFRRQGEFVIWAPQSGIPKSGTYFGRGNFIEGLGHYFGGGVVSLRSEMKAPYKASF